MAGFTINDKRGSRMSGSSPMGRLTTTNLNTHMQELRKAGHTLPNSGVQARIETAKVMDSVNNRTLTAEMGQRRQATAMASGQQRTGANVQLALPKIRKPMSSFDDKGIPWDTSKPDKLAEIRRWCRTFYTTHDLIPLLIDIYAKFPVIGMEFDCKDPAITDFHESMFMDTLDYETWLPDYGREYWIAGEVNSLAHFSDTLGIFSAEEILNPDTIRVTRPLFGTQASEGPKERVQLLVKDLVEGLRNGLGANPDDLTHSERLQRAHEYEILIRDYPDMIAAAATDDGLDLSDALISRTVNKVAPWDVRGTPHLMRSFRTLMMEESLNAAQDAVADRLYSPLILATLGIQNLDEAGPWIPDQSEIEQTRDNLQAALAADFRLLVHHFGLDIKSVFGRESVPRFDQDYTRIDKKLMQAWGIGEALLSGGTGTTNYASTALNREFVTQHMLSYQNSVKKHIRKRMMVIAEAQEHFDYEIKGGRHEPIYREVVEVDPESGEEYLRKVPKLLIPEIKFQSLNLRDESQERAFLQQLKNAGFPISDHALAINVPIEFETELDRKSEEDVEKLVAQAQSMKKAYDLIKKQNLPIPPELAKYNAAQSQLDREEAMADQAKANADKAATDAETGAMAKDEYEETGIMPGTAAPGGAAGGDSAGPNDMDNGISNSLSDAKSNPTQGDGGKGGDNATQPRNNATRPAESDEQRAGAPKAARRKFGQDPTSLGTAKKVSEKRVQEAIDRMANGLPTVRDLISSQHFYQELNEHDANFEADWPEIEAFHLASDAERDKADPHIRTAHTDLSEMLEQYQMIRGVQPLWM